MSKTAQQYIYKVHAWLGLMNGAWLLILGLSGALLVYYQDIDRLLNKSSLTVSPEGKQLPLDTLYNIVRSKYPEANSIGIMRFPKHARDCLSFRLYGQSSKKSIFYSWDLYQVDINPYTGTILRKGYYRDGVSFMHWLFSFHYSLHMGTVGGLIITLAGLLLFINILTGSIIYRKYLIRALSFRAPIHWKNWRTGTSGLHRYIGVWSLFFNGMIFFSGLEMTWNVFEKESWIVSEPGPKNEQPYASLDQILRKVQAIYPGFKITFMHIPFRVTDEYNKPEYISVYGNLPGTPQIIAEGSSNVVFHPNSGEIISKVNINESIKKMRLWQQFKAITYSFHVGSFAGNYSRIAYLFIGLSPAFLSITGFMLWWRRKKLFKTVNK